MCGFVFWGVLGLGLFRLMLGVRVSLGFGVLRLFRLAACNCSGLGFV